MRIVFLAANTKSEPVENVNVTDSRDLVQKFDANGNFILKWGSNGTADGQLHDPHGIAIDSSGDVYVVDTFNQRVQKFDANGNFILKWGSSGTADGQFLHPHDVAVSRSGYVYVGDYHIPNVQKFDANGNFILKWGSNGTADGEFLQERNDEGTEGIDVDSAGNVFVADSGNSRVQKFDANGNFILKWGSNGTADGEFDYPSGLAVDSHGNVFVSDEGNKNIQEFGGNGEFITKWGSRALEMESLIITTISPTLWEMYTKQTEQTDMFKNLIVTASSLLDGRQI